MPQDLPGYLTKMAALVSESERVTLREGPVAAPSLSAMRKEMAVVLAAYQLFVHREIFGPLIAGRDTTRADRAQALKADCIRLAQDFHAFTRDLLHVDVTLRWDRYVHESQAIRARIRRHIEEVRLEANSPVGG